MRLSATIGAPETEGVRSCSGQGMCGQNRLFSRLGGDTASDRGLVEVARAPHHSAKIATELHGISLIEDASESMTTMKTGSNIK